MNAAFTFHIENDPATFFIGSLVIVCNNERFEMVPMPRVTSHFEVWQKWSS